MWSVTPYQYTVATIHHHQNVKRLASPAWWRASIDDFCRRFVATDLEAPALTQPPSTFYRRALTPRGVST